MNDHDQRQLESMRHQIEAFRNGTIDLPWLISSLESLRHALQEIPLDWVDRFWAKWGILEEIYSLSVVREKPLSATDQVEIGQVIGDIEAMIAGMLPEPASDD